MPEYTVNLSDEEEKALLINVKAIQTWLDNAIHVRARLCIDDICEKALQDRTHTILTVAEKRQLRAWLENQDIILTSVKELPYIIKRQIVEHARIKTIAEQEAEEQPGE